MLSTERYAGYRAEDHEKPFAKYFRPRTDPPQQGVLDAVERGPVDAASLPCLAQVADDLRPDGRSPIESGYGRRPDGEVVVAVLTAMPRNTAAMWDWWFGWHSDDSAKYKLWHPDEHRFASIKHDRTSAPIPDRARYIGNVSYVDELIGPTMHQLRIAFRDPATLGLSVPDGHTAIVARVGSSIAPVDMGWVVHQVRPVAGGAEMRSRFFLNIRGMHRPEPGHAASAVRRGAALDPRNLGLGLRLARQLLLHCGQEMNHLSRFLPELYDEFAG